MTLSLKGRNTKIPKGPGTYWGKWRIAEDGTDDVEDVTPSDMWQAVEVFENTIDPTDDNHLMVWVPRVSKPQSILNFFWGDALKPPK